MVALISRRDASDFQDSFEMLGQIVGRLAGWYHRQVAQRRRRRGMQIARFEFAYFDAWPLRNDRKCTALSPVVSTSIRGFCYIIEYK